MKLYILWIKNFPLWFVSLSWYFISGMLELCNFFFFFFCGLKTEFPWWGGRGLGLFILVQTEIGSLHDMLGLEPLGQETLMGGRGSQAGVSLLLVPFCQLQARRRASLTFLMPHLQQTSNPSSRRGAQLFWWAIAFWPGKTFCKRIKLHQLDMNRQLHQRLPGGVLQPCFALWGHW